MENITKFEKVSISQYNQDLEDGTPIIACNIRPFVKLNLPELNTAIPKSEFTSHYDTLYDDANTFVFYNVIIFYI